MLDGDGCEDIALAETFEFNSVIILSQCLNVGRRQCGMRNAKVSLASADLCAGDLPGTALHIVSGKKINLD